MGSGEGIFDRGNSIWKCWRRKSVLKIVRFWNNNNIRFVLGLLWEGNWGIDYRE